MATFGERLASIRHRNKWNIRQASIICGFAPGTWRGWELEGCAPQRFQEVTWQIHVRTAVDLLWLREGPYIPVGCCVAPGHDGHDGHHGAPTVVTAEAPLTVG